jgi:hypothetical protein
MQLTLFKGVIMRIILVLNCLPQKWEDFISKVNNNELCEEKFVFTTYYHCVEMLSKDENFDRFKSANLTIPIDGDEKIIKATKIIMAASAAIGEYKGLKLYWKYIREGTGLILSMEIKKEVQYGQNNQ